MRMVIDRLQLGHRFNRALIVYLEDFEKLALAFRVLGYKTPDPLYPEGGGAGRGGLTRLIDERE